MTISRLVTYYSAGRFSLRDIGWLATLNYMEISRLLRYVLIKQKEFTEPMVKKSVVMLIVAVLALSALAVPAVSAQDGLGTEANPIQVYFVPSGEAQTIVETGDVLAQALKDATGYEFQ